MQGRHPSYDSQMPISSPDHPSSSSASGSHRVETIGFYEVLIPGRGQDHQQTFHLRALRGAPPGVDHAADHILGSVFSNSNQSFQLVMEAMEFEHLVAAFGYGATVRQWLKVGYVGTDRPNWDAWKTRAQQHGTVSLIWL